MHRLFAPVLVSVLLAGCPSDPPIPDAGRDAPIADAPISDVPLDASGPDVPGDAPSVDAPACACDGDQSCLRGVCVATCAGVAGLDAALAPGVVPVSHTCRAPSAFDVVGTNVYELESVAATDGSTTLRLVRWALTGGAVAPATLAQRVYVPVGDPAELVFPGFVAVSDDETHAVFGYTTSRAGFVGGVVDVTTAAMTFEEAAAPGNFDAGFVQGTQYLVNGLGHGSLTGQALYLVDAADTFTPRAAVTGMGDASGSVALWAEQDILVFGGAYYGGTWPDGSSGGLVFALDLDRVTGASSPVDAYATGHRLTDVPTAFELLSGGRLAALRYDATFALDGIALHQLGRAGTGAVTAAPPVEISVDGTFTGVGAVEDDVLLVHASGALRVRLP